MSMLHIVNGDSVGKKLQQEVVEGLWRAIFGSGERYTLTQNGLGIVE